MRRLIAVLLVFITIISLAGCTEETPQRTNPSADPSVSDPSGSNDPSENTSETDDPQGNLPTETDPSEDSATPTPPATDGSSTDTPDASEPDSSASQDTLFEMLFDIENKVSVQLDMSDEELAKMQADYERYDQNGSKSPVYRMADLTVTVTTPSGESETYFIPEVGVRMKGNTSRTAFYNEKEGIYNLIHLKLSFQETFDDPELYGSEVKTWTKEDRQARKNRTFATLEKLDLRWNRCDDSTYLKEYFAYATYREYGVLAPHTNLASFNWAGIHMGVYTINEPVDKVFLEKNLPAEALGGDLYKIGWAGSSNGSFTNLSSIGIEDELNGKFYAYDLKTNKKTSSHESLTTLIKALNTGTVTKERFAELVDLDTFLPYCAVSYLLGNPDDLRNNYNNSYVYFRADNGKAVIIPYDFDRCLGITAHWNPTGDGVTSDDPFGKTLLATGEEQRNPLILYSVASGGYYVREYAAILQQIAEGDWFTYENFASIYAIAAANYSALTTPSKEFHNTGGLYLSFSLERTSAFSSNGNISIRQYLNAKLSTLSKYLEKTDENASAKPPAASTGWYARADYTDWAINDKHTLTEENGLWVYTVTRSREFRMKIYNSVLDEWYGSECVAENSPIGCSTDNHTNIILPAGSYRITIDPVTEIITIEEQ